MLGYNRGSTLRNGNLSKKLNNLGPIIKSIANFGMVINKKVLEKKQAIPEDPRLDGELYSILDSIGNRSNTTNTTHPQYNQSDQIQRQAKRWSLIMMSKHPELEDIVETLTDEVIVYDKNSTYCCSAKLNKLMLDDEIISSTDAKDLEDLINEKFPTLYRMLGLYKSGAKKLFQDWLVEGKKAWEIVYDNIDNPKAIIGLIPIDPLSLLEHWDEDGNRWWIQEPSLTQKTNSVGQSSLTGKRVLHDSQVIYWDWDEDGFKFSYIERLIRSFNIYRTVERMRLNWWVMNSQFRTQIIIPTHGKSRQKAAQTLSAAMQRYRDHIEFNDEDGVTKVNGSVNIPANKEYWLADTSSGKPDVSQVGGEGFDLSSSDTSEFKKNFHHLSKVPIDRFDPTSSESWNIDPTSSKRQELKFSKFTQSLRTSMSEIMLKPLLIQICLDRPKLTNNFELLDAVVIDFLTENIFTQKIEMEIMNERAEFIGNLMDKVKRIDSEGNEKPALSLEFLMDKFAFLTPEEMEQNAKLLKKEEREMEEFSKRQNEISAEMEATKAEYTAEFDDSIDDMKDKNDNKSKSNKLYEAIKSKKQKSKSLDKYRI